MTLLVIVVKGRSKALVLIVVLTIALLAPRLPIARLDMASAVTQGNWTISNTQEVKDQTVTLNGNLTVENGGNLTLVDTSLNMNSGYLGEYHITVMPGGSMYIYNSEIVGSISHPYAFAVEGSNFVMENSILQDAGWCDLNASGLPQCGNNPTSDPAMQQHGGLVIQTNGAKIEGSLISENAIGLILDGSNDTVQSNNFTRNAEAAILLSGSDGDLVVNNTISQSMPYDEWEVYLGNSNNDLFKNNSLTSTPVTQARLVYLISGFTVQNSQGNSFSDNSMAVSDPLEFLGSNNNTVIHNSVHAYGDAAMHIVQSSYTRVVNNSILLESNGIFGPTWDGAPAPAGVVLISCPNSTVAGNTMTGKYGTFSADLFLGHSSGSFVEDNRFLTFTNSPGVYVYGSQNTTIAGNVIANSWQGLWLYYGSNGNEITDNTIYSNSTSNYFYSPPRSSIIIGNSSANTIYMNNFYDGGGGPYDDGGNTWSVNGTGNYWSFEHNGSAVSIEPEGTDAHPLTDPVVLNLSSVKVLVEPARSSPAGSTYNLDVSGNTTINNQVGVYSSANIRIESGGELTIKDSSLTFGEGGIGVEAGGAVMIENSTLIGLSGIGDYGLGGSVTILKSNILCGQNEALGFGSGANITVVNSSITSIGDYGFNFYFFGGGGGGGPVLNITNSQLDGGAPIGELSAGTITMGQGNLYMYNTTMKNDMTDIQFSGSKASIVDSSFIGGFSGSSISATTIVFQGNTVLENGYALSGTDVTFNENKITSDWGSFVQVNANTASAVGNQINFKRGFQPLALWASESVVSNNTVSSTLTSGGFGIFLNVNNSTVTGNRESGSGGMSINGNYNAIIDNTIANAPGGINIDGSSNLIFHNNFLNVQPSETGSGNDWSYGGEGNYWSSYTGSDANLDGIGDTPYVMNGITDSSPYMQPNGWLTNFYLNVKTNLTTTSSFAINGSDFSTGPNGTGIYRLGYDANYSFTFPEVITLPNGTSYSFAGWSDGYTGATRTILMYSNSTVMVTYTKQIQQQRTTTSITSSLTNSSSSISTSKTTSSSYATTSVSSSNPTITETSTSPISSSNSSSSSSSLTVSSSQSSTTGNGGGIPEFPYSVGIAVVFVVLVVGAYLFLRRRSGT